MSITVPFLSLKHHYQNHKQAFDEAYERVMTSGHYILGPEVDAFENELKNLSGASHNLGTGNGLDALSICLRSLNLNIDDEVIVPAHTFVATWLAVSHVGAKIVPVDIEPDTFNIDPEEVIKAITSKTKAVIGVHLYGRPFNAQKLKSICDDNNITLIEDAAQAHGASFKTVPTGSLGHMAAFSFYPGKNLGAFGDGGAITTNNSELASKCKLIRNYGSPKKYLHTEIGVNSRLDELQAALLRVKLQNYTQELNARKSIAASYIHGLSNVGDIVTPSIHEEGQHSWHLFVIKTKHRDALQSYLSKKGVVTLIHYPTPCHMHTCYKDLNYQNGDFPVSEKTSEQILSLPMGSHLNEEQVSTVVLSIKSFFS